MAEEENVQQLIRDLAEQIHAELQVITEADMPVVYGMSKTEDGLVQLETMIATRVLTGLSIPEAISDIELEMNANRID